MKEKYEQQKVEGAVETVIEIWKLKMGKIWS